MTERDESSKHEYSDEKLDFLISEALADPETWSPEIAQTMTEIAAWQERQMQDQEPPRPLTLREYIGILGPNYFTKEQLEERAKDPRPLTVGEYFRIRPVPTVYEMADFAINVGRGIKRFWSRTTSQ